MTSEKYHTLAQMILDGRALEHASDELKADREVVLAAVKQDGNALKYAGGKLKSDREVVLAAVKQNGNALEYADDLLKAEREVVLAAIMNFRPAKRHAPSLSFFFKSVSYAKYKFFLISINFSPSDLIIDASTPSNEVPLINPIAV